MACTRVQKRGGTYRTGKKTTKNVARSSGLKRWFKEKWVDVKTGKPCGRKKGEKRAYRLQTK